MVRRDDQSWYWVQSSVPNRGGERASDITLEHSSEGGQLVVSCKVKANCFVISVFTEVD